MERPRCGGLQKRLEEIRSGGNALLSVWHTLDRNFMDWCSSKYSEAQKSAVESLAILLGQYEVG